MSIEMKRVVQIGVVCKDAKAALEKFCELFKVDPKASMLLADTAGMIHNATYYGKSVQFDLGIGLVNYGGLQFEFIQPIRGDDNPYSDYLKRNPEGGIHHIHVKWADFNEASKALAEAGGVEMTSGELMGGDYTYVDMLSQMGLVFESSAGTTDDYGIGNLMP